MLALEIVWARAMPTMPQPVPSSRIVKGEASVECNRAFANVDFVSAKSGIWQARVMPASLQRQPQWAMVEKRCWKRQVYHRCFAMLSPVSSQMAMSECGDRLKRRWTNLGASSSKVKGALQADTTPRASWPARAEYSSGEFPGPMPTLRRNSEDGSAWDLGSGIVMGRERMPLAQRTEVQTRTCSTSWVHSRSSAARWTWWGRNESPRSETRVARQATLAALVVLSRRMRGGLRKRR